MMTIDYIYPYYFNATVGPAGTMRRILSFKNYFKEKGYDVNVYMWDIIKGIDVNNCIDIKTMNVTPPLDISKGVNFREFIKGILRKYSLTTELFVRWKIRKSKNILYKYLSLNRNPDIIVFGDDELCYQYLKLKKIHRAKIALFQHSDGLNKSMLLKSYPKLSKKGIYKKLVSHFEYLLNNVDMFVFIASTSQRNFLTINKNFPKEKTYFLYNGIENKEIEYHQINYNLINVCCTGSVLKRKGQHLIIEAINQLPNEDKNRFIVNIIGDGPDLDYLRNLIQKYKLNHCVNLLGNVPNNEIHNILLKQDIFILMSNNEGLPISIIEALRAGLPIISTNVAGIPELVVNNNGIIISPNSDELARVLKNYRKYNWQEMGQASRCLFEKNFTFNQMMDNYIGLFNKLIQ